MFSRSIWVFYLTIFVWNSCLVYVGMQKYNYGNKKNDEKFKTVLYFIADKSYKYIAPNFDKYISLGKNHLMVLWKKKASWAKVMQSHQTILFLILWKYEISFFKEYPSLSVDFHLNANKVVFIFKSV